jgi:hypothetical protein
MKLDVVAELDRHAERVGREAPALDQMRNQVELRILVERLIENGFEDRLRIRREPLVGIPRRDIVRPSDRDRIIAGGGCAHCPGARSRDDCHCCLQEGSALQLQGHGVLLRFGCNRLTIAHPDAFRANEPHVGLYPNSNRSILVFPRR